jgi:hypothetical protein
MTAQVTESSMERLLEGLANAVEQKMAAKSNKAVTSLGSYGNYAHGPGLFTPVMDPNVINAVQLPFSGLYGMLPEIATDLEAPLYGLITGQTQNSAGTGRGDDCSPWGTAGFTQICRQTEYLATQGITSPVINLNRLGHLVDRADFTDYRLIGDPFNYAAGDNGLSGMPGFGTGGADFMNSDLGKIVREMDIEMVRRFYPDLWTSNPSTAADDYHDSWYRGMQLKVNTGYQDVITGTACTAADSLVIPFATVATGGTNITTIASASTTMVDIAQDLYFTFERKARQQGLDPVQWVFAGTPELFRELTAVWPCSYMINRCLTASAGTPATAMASDMLAMREQMRQGSYLLIEGKQIPFVVDESIPQTQGTGAAGAGTYTSDLYLLPLTVRGGFPVLFKTYFNYNKRGAAAEAIAKFGSSLYGVSVSPNGKYLYSSDKTFECFKIKATFRPGLVLRTPFLAARITNISYKPRLVTTSWNPSAPSNYVGGGVSIWQGTAPSVYLKDRSGE